MLQSEKMAAIGQLAAGIAHEINNPTGFVSSNLTTLGEYSEDISKIIDHYKSVISLLKDSGKRSKYKDDISLKLNEIEAIELALDINFILIDIENLISESKEGVVRIKNIVDDLKDFAHPGQNKPECSNINRNLDSTLSMICGEIKKNKVKVIKEYGNIPSIVCYPQKLNQVFMNVLVNALQSMRKNGKLTITTSVINSHLKIDISDNGSGIPKKNLQKIFDPFFTTKPVGKGTGLGLNIAYNIIKEHNGNITAHSLQGKGTTFSITLPLN